MVESSAAVIWNPPSPATTQTSLSGQAILAPIAAGQSKAHGAEAARGDQRARLFVVEVLRLPHLVLAYVGDNDRVAAGDAPQIVHHMRRVQMAGVGQILDVAHRALRPCWIRWS